jgi:broad specificity phosphatase PhoE
MTIVKQIFYVARHGQTTDNAKGLISGGSSDPDLTDLGRQQAVDARAVFDALHPIPMTIVTTGLRRTKITAEILTQRADYVVDSGLNERHFYAYDGLLTVDEQKRLGHVEGEETREQQSLRVIPSVNRHVSAAVQPVLFVLHAGTIRRVFDALGIKNNHDIDNLQFYQCVPVGEQWSVFELSVEHGQLQKKPIDAAPDTEMAKL